jgi:predicted RNase H-like HicB family nuclease
MTKRKYRAVFEREADGWWVASVPDVPGCHTQGRTIAQARERLVEALAVSLDVGDASDLADRLVPDVRLPRRIDAIISTFREARETADSAQVHAHLASKRAVVMLTNLWGLSLRDAGDLLGLSHQRVAQILEDKRRKDRAEARG